MTMCDVTDPSWPRLSVEHAQSRGFPWKISRENWEGMLGRTTFINSRRHNEAVWEAGSAATSFLEHSAPV